MRYIALLVAFLCEMTVYPIFIKNPIHVESILLGYFVIILATNKKVSVAYPVVLLLISSVVTAQIVGLASVLVLIGTLVHHQLFVVTERSRSLMKKPTHASVIAKFSIIFFIISLLKIIILYSFGYSISPLLEFFTYIINIAIFIILIVCVL